MNVGSKSRVRTEHLPHSPHLQSLPCVLPTPFLIMFEKANFNHRNHCGQCTPNWRSCHNPYSITMMVLVRTMFILLFQEMSKALQLVAWHFCQLHLFVFVFYVLHFIFSLFCFLFVFGPKMQKKYIYKTYFC